MKTYARILDGRVAEVIAPFLDPDGEEVPIEQRFAPAIVAELVEYDPANPPPMPPEPPGPSVPELIARALAETRTQRQPILSVLDGLQSSALALGDQPKAVLIEHAKQALREITSIDLSGCATFEAMRQAIKAKYLQLASTAPADVRTAFSEAIK